MAELLRTEEGQVAVPPTAAEMGKTVREQLAEALTWLLEHSVDCTKSVCGRCILLDAKARKALDRARAEPEWLSQCCGAPPHGSPDLIAPTTPTPIGVCGNCREHTTFERTVEHCHHDGADCPTWQAGHDEGYSEGTEAQRERVGGGRA